MAAVAEATAAVVAATAAAAEAAVAKAVAVADSAAAGNRSTKYFAKALERKPGAFCLLGRGWLHEVFCCERQRKRRLTCDYKLIPTLHLNSKKYG
jgi:hypothetical protein